ncbi:hypothetical protein BDR26DRAFT_855619 [Obelidium mucronatum]|nr:hypothetical protein BDR26DRAFT_855619 [Obelidium mucronatum]
MSASKKKPLPPQTNNQFNPNPSPAIPALSQAFSFNASHIPLPQTTFPAVTEAASGVLDSAPSKKLFFSAIPTNLKFAPRDGKQDVAPVASSTVPPISEVLVSSIETAKTTPSFIPAMEPIAKSNITGKDIFSHVANLEFASTFSFGQASTEQTTSVKSAEALVSIPSNKNPSTKSSSTLALASDTVPAGHISGIPSKAAEMPDLRSKKLGLHTRFALDAVPVTPITSAMMLSGQLGPGVNAKTKADEKGIEIKQQNRSSALLFSSSAPSSSTTEDVFGDKKVIMDLEKPKTVAAEHPLEKGNKNDQPYIPFAKIPIPALATVISAAPAAEKSSMPAQQNVLKSLFMGHEEAKKKQGWKTLVVPPSPMVSVPTPVATLPPALPVKSALSNEPATAIPTANEPATAVPTTRECQEQNSSALAMSVSGSLHILAEGTTAAAHSEKIDIVKDAEKKYATKVNVTPPSKIPVPLSSSSRLSMKTPESIVQKDMAVDADGHMKVRDVTEEKKDTTPKATSSSGAIKSDEIQAITTSSVQKPEVLNIGSTRVAGFDFMDCSFENKEAPDEDGKQEEDGEDENPMISDSNALSLLLNESVDYETIQDDLSAPRLDMSFTRLVVAAGGGGGGGIGSWSGPLQSVDDGVGGDDPILNDLLGNERMEPEFSISIGGGGGVGVGGEDYGLFDVSEIVGSVVVGEKGVEVVDQVVASVDILPNGAAIECATGGGGGGGNKSGAGKKSGQQGQGDFAPRGSLGPGGNRKSSGTGAGDGSGGGSGNGDDEDNERRWRQVDSGHKVNDGGNRGKQQQQTTAAVVNSKLGPVFAIKNGVASGDLIKKRGEETLEDVQDRLVSEFTKALEKALEAIEKDKMDEKHFQKRVQDKKDEDDSLTRRIKLLDGQCLSTQERLASLTRDLEKQSARKQELEKRNSDLERRLKLGKLDEPNGIQHLTTFQYAQLWILAVIRICFSVVASCFLLYCFVKWLFYSGSRLQQGRFDQQLTIQSQFSVETLVLHIFDALAEFLVGNPAELGIKKLI